jgi:membrane-associated phospholipid phosphatase
VERRLHRSQLTVSMCRGRELTRVYLSFISGRYAAFRTTSTTMDRDIQQAAEFLAAHSVVLLGLGMLGAVVSLVAVVLTVRLSLHVRGQLRLLMRLIVRAHGAALVRQLIAWTSAFVPNGSLALHLTLGLALTAAATIFLILAEEVAAGGPVAAFDVAFARALWTTTTPGWQRIFAVVSWLGSRDVLGVATLLVAAALLLRRRTLIAIGWIGAQAGGGILNMVLKETFERTRPEFADPMLASSSWSFPSGHAMGTFIFFGLGSYLLLREVRLWPTAGIIVTIAVAWCMAMSFSRLYLGVHFASAVAAGLIAGGAWVAVCVSGLELLQQRLVMRQDVVSDADTARITIGSRKSSRNNNPDSSSSDNRNSASRSVSGDVA